MLALHPAPATGTAPSPRPVAVPLPLESDYAGWRFGFTLPTFRVRKWPRPAGLLDVLYRKTNGCHSGWVADARSIWLVTRKLTTVEPLLAENDLLLLFPAFPSQPLTSPFLAYD